MYHVPLSDMALFFIFCFCRICGVWRVRVFGYLSHDGWVCGIWLGGKKGDLVAILSWVGTSQCSEYSGGDGYWRCERL